METRIKQVSRSIDITTFFKKMLGGHKFFLRGHWYACFLDLWWTHPWVWKPGQIHLLACFFTSVPWILHIHLWCSTCWPFTEQHGSWTRYFHSFSSIGVTISDLTFGVDLSLWFILKQIENYTCLCSGPNWGSAGAGIVTSSWTAGRSPYWLRLPEHALCKETTKIPASAST